MDPKCSMYGIFTYIHHNFMVNVGKYSIHGTSGDGWNTFSLLFGMMAYFQVLCLLVFREGIQNRQQGLLKGIERNHGA